MMQELDFDKVVERDQDQRVTVEVNEQVGDHMRPQAPDYAAESAAEQHPFDLSFTKDNISEHNYATHRLPSHRRSSRKEPERHNIDIDLVSSIISSDESIQDKLQQHKEH